MIRERVPMGQFIQQEIVQSIFRLWFCTACGVEFSVRAEAQPHVCPVCLVPFDVTPRVTTAHVEDFLNRLRGIEFTKIQAAQIELVLRSRTRL